MGHGRPARGSAIRVCIIRMDQTASAFDLRWYLAPTLQLTLR